jgi:hypothetical protein
VRISRCFSRPGYISRARLVMTETRPLVRGGCLNAGVAEGLVRSGTEDTASKAVRPRL